MRLRVKVALGALAFVLVGLAAAFAVVLSKLPEIAAGQASRMTGRSVTIGSVSVSLGRWVGVEVRGATLANLPGGSRAEMAILAKLTGEVALWPLLHGTIVARSVRVEKADILLEKVRDQPNWRNGPRRPEKPGGGRTTFPTLLGAAFDGVVTFRTTSGHPLVTTLNGIRLEVTAADQAARIAGPGSYQGVPIELDGKLGSFDQLHDAAIPFPTDIQLISGDTVLHFTGTMTRPLDVDGAEGQLSLRAPTPAVLEKVAGADPSPAPPLRMEGAFTHDADLWRLQDAQGALGDSALENGSLQLREGSAEAKTPDKVDADLRFAEVNVDRLLVAFKGGAASADASGGESSFVPQADPNPQVSAKLEAADLVYEKIRFVQPKLSVRLAPGLLSLDGASFGALGGQVKLEGSIQAEPDGKTGGLGATITATDLEVSQLRQAIGVSTMPLAGRMDLHVAANGKAATAAAALRGGQASIVATMQGGSVSDQVVRLASTDITGLVRPSRTMVPLTCLLAVLEVRGGIATVGPLRLRSAQGTIVGRGRVDLLRETLDVVVASEARTTGALALDVPIRVSGKSADPTLAPAGAAAGRNALSSGPLGELAASVKGFAQRSSCAR